MLKCIWVRAALIICPSLFLAQTPHEGNFVISDFPFADGERMPKLNLHYMTFGRPKRDAEGHVTNAVLIMHGTGGSGKQFLAPQFRDVLFQPGQLLDPSKYYIILPDDIDTAIRRSRAMRCTDIFRITDMQTWLPPNTVS